MFTSIIIPTYNRSDLLEKGLLSIIQQDIPASEFEIIVADNGSTDNTAEVVRRVAFAASNHSVRYFHEPVPGLLSGRHKGALEAKGDILIFLDDDVEVETGWLKAIISRFESNADIHLVGGPSIPKYEITPPDWLQYFWKKNGEGILCTWLSLFDGGDKAKEIEPSYIWGLNFSIRKKTLFDLGGFHPDNIPSKIQYLQGDGESGLCMKLKEKGLKAWYEPKAKVYHNIPKERLTLKYFHARAFYSGVCHSFSDIRKEGQLSESSAKGQEQVKDAKSLLRRLKYTLLQSNPKYKAELLKQEFRKTYIKGYEYHQEHAREHSEVLQWVLRDNYWDYALPSVNGSKN